MISRNRFDGTRVGPAGLRPLLRQLRMPGERLIGWGVVTRPPGITRQVAMASMYLIPGLGGVAAVALGRGATRLCILSDTRLILVVGGSRRGEVTLDHVLVHEPLARVGVEILGERRIALSIPRWPAPRIYTVLGSDEHATERLLRGLRVIAGSPVREDTRARMRKQARTNHE